MPQNDLLNASDFLETPVEQELSQEPINVSQRPSLASPKTEEPTARTNLPETLNIAGVDTGLPLDKDTAAFLVGMGDGITDTWQGVQQLLGSKEMEADLAADKELMNELYNDPRVGGVATGGRVTGFLVDPVGVLVPMGKGKNLYDVAKVGAATGATFGGLGYVDEANGQSRLGNAAIGMVAGGVISPTLFGATRAAKGIGGKVQERATDTLLNTYKKQYMQFVAEGRTPAQATHYAMKRMGWTTEDKAKLIAASRKDFRIDVPMDSQGRVSAAKAQANFDSMRNRTIANLDKFMEKTELRRSIKSAVSSFGSAVKSGIVPISTRIAAKDSDLAVQLIKMESRVHKASLNMREEIAGFESALEHLHKNTKHGQAFERALFDGDIVTSNAIWRQVFGTSKGKMKEFDKVRGILDNLYKEAKAVGYDLPKLDHYFPRRIKNGHLDKLAALDDSRFSAELAQFRLNNRREPSDKEISKMLANIRNPKSNQKAKTGGALKSRTRKAMSLEEMEHYHSAIPTLRSHINDMVSDIERARFFNTIRTGKGHKYDMDGSDLTEIMGKSLAERQAQGRYHVGDIQDLTDILRSRFTNGEMAPSAAVQAFKNSTYIATLGNFKSAMTQIGDLAWSAHRNGIINTVIEALNGIPGFRRMIRDSHQRATKEQIGLEDAIQEMAGDQTGKKAMDYVLRKTGFKAMDKFGKDTFINANLRKVKKNLNDPKRAAKEKMALRRKWTSVFGDETDDMIADLQQGKLSDNVAVYLFDSLSDVQPISLSEMPQAYLNNPNGRIFYMLRSFTIKQLDMMRRDILDNAAKGNYPEALKKGVGLGSLFVAANGSADMLKDFMSGKEIEMEDTIVDNIWKLVGMNRYTGDRVIGGTPGQAIVDMIAPPLTVYDRAIRGLSDPQKLYDASPINGSQVIRNLITSGEFTNTPTNSAYDSFGKFHDTMDK